MQHQQGIHRSKDDQCRTLYVPSFVMSAFAVDKSTLSYKFFILFQYSLFWKSASGVSKCWVFWSTFSCIWTEFRDLWSNSPHTRKYRTEKSVFQHFSRSANWNIGTKWVKDKKQVTIYHIQHDKCYTKAGIIRLMGF